MRADLQTRVGTFSSLTGSRDAIAPIGTRPPQRMWAVLLISRVAWARIAVLAIAEATEHKQWEETKAQEPKPEYKTKDNQKLFTQH
jgi:hypothetical protein